MIRVKLRYAHDLHVPITGTEHTPPQLWQIIILLIWIISATEVAKEEEAQEAAEEDAVEKEAKYTDGENVDEVVADIQTGVEITEGDEGETEEEQPVEGDQQVVEGDHLSPEEGQMEGISEGEEEKVLEVIHPFRYIKLCAPTLKRYSFLFLILLQHKNTLPKMNWIPPWNQPKMSLHCSLALLCVWASLGTWLWLCNLLFQMLRTDMLVLIRPFFVLPGRVGINAAGEKHFNVYPKQKNLVVIFRKYSVSRLTCSDRVSFKTQILRAVLIN